MKKDKSISQAQKKHKSLLKPIIAMCLCIAILLSLFILRQCQKSNAYLYETNSIDVSYSVAQLDIDVFSDHMYTYYTGDTTPFNQNTTDAIAFGTMLTELASYMNLYGTTANDERIKTILSTYYNSDFMAAINSLVASSSQDTYDTNAVKVYNNYYTKYNFLFKIKNMDYSSNLWYSYADDLVKTYYGKVVEEGNYVDEQSGSSKRTATLKFGVKLKGGTTFSNDTNGSYYDEHFNEMVRAFNLRFENTGNTSLFMSLGLSVASEAEKGVANIVMPYGYNVHTVTDYRSFIANLLFNAINSNLAAYLPNNTSLNSSQDSLLAQLTAYTSTYTSLENIESLSFSDLSNLISLWNNFAISSYLYNNNNRNNTHNNYSIDYQESAEPNTLKDITIGMMAFADYETCKSYYAANMSDKDWRTSDDYMLIRSNFVLTFMTSLKNQDMRSVSDEDWNKIYNSKQTYNKFVGISNFDVEGYAYFKQSDNKLINASEHMRGGYIIADYTDETAENYIGKFGFNVNFRGFSPAYIRVRLLEQFTNPKGEIVAINLLPFKFCNNWLDRRSTDLYIYSQSLFNSTDKDIKTSLGKAPMISIPVVSGLTQTNLGAVDSTLTKDQNMTLKLSLYIEAVQPNRIYQYWNLNSIPTE